MVRTVRRIHVVSFIALLLLWGRQPLVSASDAFGSLLVESDPSGAAVYVDSHLAGETPLTIPTLAVGVHRVRLLRLGYLENSRLVTVKAGSRATLRTRLTSPQPQTAGQAALRVVVLEGEGAVNIIQQNTAVAPVVEVRDRNDQPVAGAVVQFAIRSGRATFSGARTISVTTDAGGRAIAAGFAPTGTGGLQIGATAAFQGQTAAITIAQTTVTTAAQAAAVSSAAGAGAGGGGGLSATTVGVITGAVAGGVVVGVKTLGGGGTTFRGDYAGQIVMTAGIAPAISCTFVETVTGSVTITLDDPSSATGSAEVKERSTVTGGTCGNLGSSANDDADGPVSGTPGNLTFSLQKTNSIATGGRIKPWSFIGQLNGNEITGVLTTGDINQTSGGVIDARGSTSIPITLR